MIPLEHVEGEREIRIDDMLNESVFSMRGLK